MTPRWRSLLAVILAMAIGAALGMYAFQQVQGIYLHVKADHQAIHELAYIEMQRQQAGKPKAQFDPAPPATSTGK